LDSIYDQEVNPKDILDYVGFAPNYDAKLVFYKGVEYFELFDLTTVPKSAKNGFVPKPAK
jgi:hypothetical protein